MNHTINYSSNSYYGRILNYSCSNGLRNDVCQLTRYVSRIHIKLLIYKIKLFAIFNMLLSKPFYNIIVVFQK